MITRLFSTSDSISAPSLAYGCMAKRWELLDCLRGGTLAMQEAGEKWLPRENEEPILDYKIRLKRSVLYNGYSDTVKKLAAKPFGKPIAFENQSSLPIPVQKIIKNATRNGETLGQFAHKVFEESVHRGLTHVLVDYPVAPENATLADAEKNLLYPYFTHISPYNLIKWISKEINGIEVLQEIRIREVKTVPDGQYGEKQVIYIRVIKENSWELLEVEGRAEKRVDSGVMSANRIELHTFYTNKTGFLQGEPPLEDLGWINLAHWQSQSDQRNILRFARLGFLVATGLSDAEQKAKIIVGPNSVLKLTNPEAKVFYAEHSGKAIGAGNQDLKNLEAHMRILGLQPVVEGGSSTATGSAIEESKTHAQAQTWALEFSDFLYSLFEAACRWVSAPIPKDFKIVIFTNFAISIRAGLDAQILTSAVQTQKLSLSTYLTEMKRRGFLNEDLDIEDEIKRLDFDIEKYSVSETPPNEDKNKEASNKDSGASTANPNEFPSNQQ